jgi:hypothetical protein
MLSEQGVVELNIFSHLANIFLCYKRSTYVDLINGKREIGNRKWEVRSGKK